MTYLMDYIKRYRGNWARWNSTNPVAQRQYTANVLKVIPRTTIALAKLPGAKKATDVLAYRTIDGAGAGAIPLHLLT
jgi:hypothetical protein